MEDEEGGDPTTTTITITTSTTTDSHINDRSDIGNSSSITGGYHHHPAAASQHHLPLSQPLPPRLPLESTMDDVKTVAEQIISETKRNDIGMFNGYDLGREIVMHRLASSLVRGLLTQIDLSQRGLIPSDGRPIRLALMHNPSLSILKLGYNNLSDPGTSQIAEGIQNHPSLSTLDVGFNDVGDVGCMALAQGLRNGVLETLYLSGNGVGEGGVMALANAVRGCALSCLHLTGNKVGGEGVKSLMRAIADCEERRQEIQSNDNDDDWNINEEAESQPKADCHIHKTGISKLYLGKTAMGPTGCLSVSNMLLTNLSLKVLSLSDNGITDRDLALFSQSISRNKQAPLEVLQLSFNRLTCIGVESLMNAVWGSTTLKELRLDNNQVKDRGAQLVAVVLTSVNLETVDLGFNAITTVGVKALMKSMAENDFLKSLTLSGNPLDTNASKAVSYALAYNTSLKKLYVDHCSVGYAAQRHITAGIASNSSSALRVVTGFRVGAIAVTLGLPAALEHWTNDQVLNFFRMMWERWRQNKNISSASTLSLPNSNQRCSASDLSARSRQQNQNQNTHPNNNINNNTTNNQFITESKSADNILTNQSQSERRHTPTPPRVGPSDPATVVSAAKAAFDAMGLSNAVPPGVSPDDPNVDINMASESPLAPPNAIMMERTPSGTLRVPPMDEVSTPHSCRTPSPRQYFYIEANNCNITANTNIAATSQSLDNNNAQIDPVRQQRNLNWLNHHLNALTDLAEQPFNNAELWKLHQHFFSPVDTTCNNNNANINNNVHEFTSHSQIQQIKQQQPQSVINGHSNHNHHHQSHTYHYPFTQQQHNNNVNANGISNEITSSRLLLPPNDPRRHSSSITSLSTTGRTNSPQLERKISYRFLNDAMNPSSSSTNYNNYSHSQQQQQQTLRQSTSSPSGGRRRNVEVLNNSNSDDYCTNNNNSSSSSSQQHQHQNQQQSMYQPASKRAKRARIAYYPRIKEKLEFYRSKASQQDALVLMRQLKYVESAFLKMEGTSTRSNGYYHDVTSTKMVTGGSSLLNSDVDDDGGGCIVSPSDAEAILVDLL